MRTPIRRLLRMGCLVCLVCLACLVMGGVARAQGLPAAAHDLAVEIVPDGQVLTGRDVVRFDPPLDGVASFSLRPGAAISEATLDGEPADIAFEAGRLTVRGQGEMFAFTYSAVFDDPVPDDPATFDNPGFGVSGTIMPDGSAFFLAGSGWHPIADDRANLYQLTITAPEDVYAVTAGRSAGFDTDAGKTTSKWDVTRPIERLALSTGPYIPSEVTVADIPVYTFFSANTQSLSDLYLEATARHVAFYDELHGPYPFEKFAVVENFFPTGYGMPSYTLLGGRVLRLPFIPEISLRHEVAHSWWGNGVFVDYAQGNWCEGLATYVADYQKELEDSPDAARGYRERILRRFAALASGDAAGADFPLSQFISRTSPASSAIGYGKAMMVFHMMKDRVGEDIFWQGLRDVYERFLFREAAWTDIAAAFVRLGGWSADEAEVFLAQWVRRAGGPLLRLGAVMRVRDGAESGWKLSGTMLQESAPYLLDVPLVVETEGEPRTIMLHMDGSAVDFEAHFEDRPTRVAIDPEATLFRVLHPEEIPATVNMVKAAEKPYVITAATLDDTTGPAMGRLLMGLRQPRPRIVREEIADPDALRDVPVIFLGYPTSPKLQALIPDLADGLAIDPDGLTIDGDPVGDAVFLARKADPAQGPVRALFAWTKETTADGVMSAARKVTHYGSYSYLAFEDGENVAKGAWTISESPAMADLEN
jgi:hypothetical protein